jgi:hypothetical protein
MEVAGISNANCGACANYNGSWILKPNPNVFSNCQWDTGDAGPCGDPPGNPPYPTWFLQCSTGLWILSSGNQASTYFTQAVNWNCLGVNEIGAPPHGGRNFGTECVGWPETILLTPVFPPSA